MRDAGEVRTGKLYDLDAYAVHFSAQVTGRQGCEVILDRTLFFPEEGGQIPDRGVLGGFPVADVQIRDGVIVHTLSPVDGREPDFAPGDTVSGDIDWQLRFSNMQQHSGEHLLSGIVKREFGFDNVGFHLGMNEVTLDYNGVIPAECLEELELAVNRAVTADVPSSVRYVPAEEARGLAYRSKLELSGDVRLVEFAGYDLCACCAPHVRRTGEIGVVRIVDMIRWKGGVRLSILCGERALRLMMEEHRIVRETAGFLTTSPDRILPQVRKLREDVRALSGRVRQAAGRAAELEIAAADSGEENVVFFFEDLEEKAARDAVNGLRETHGGFSAVFLGACGGTYRFILGAGREADARKAAAALREKLNARCGGSAAMIQGSVAATEEEIRALFAEEMPHRVK